MNSTTNGLVWSKKQIESDGFCWTCHRKEPTLFCSTCVRSFHTSPVCSHSKKLSAEQMGQWRCIECIAIERDEKQTIAKHIDVMYMNRLLKFSSNLLQADQYLQPHFMNIDYSNVNGVIAMDLSIIGKKVNSDAYRCCEAFYSDIKWIMHNTKALQPSGSLAVKATNWLMKFTREEIYNIRLCHECYLNANQMPTHWFTVPCRELHLLVWAKQKKYPHWPAKILSINSDKTVDVRYFGTHSRTVLASKDCLMYSEYNPSTNIDIAYRTQLEDAQKEVDVYIQNIITKYGGFNYAKANTMLHETMLERHLYDMVPNAWNKLRKTTAPPPIPKPVPFRRKSMSSNKITAVDLEMPAISGLGRIIKRRSTLINHEENAKAKNAYINHRQSILLDEIQSHKNQVAAEAPVPSIPKVIIKLKDIIDEKPTKRRKLSEGSKTEASTVKCVKSSAEPERHRNVSSSNTPQTSDAAVKEPPKPNAMKGVPRMRKFDPKVAAYVDLFSNISDGDEKTVATSSQADKNGRLKPPCLKDEIDSVKSVKDCILPDKPIEIKRFDTKPDQNHVTLIPKVETSPEMVALCKMIVDKNAEKLIECARSSLDAALFEFVNATNSASKVTTCNCQQDAHRLEYDELIGDLQNQNHKLSREIADVSMEHNILKDKNTKLMDENSELIKTIDALKLDNIKLATDLQTAQNANDELVINLNEISIENADLNLALAKLQLVNTKPMKDCTDFKSTSNESIDTQQAANNDKAKMVKSSGEERIELVAANNSLMALNVKLTNQMDKLTLENRSQANTIKKLQNNYELIKIEAAAMTVDAKKKQWCTVCGEPGGRYYCDNHRRQPKHPKSDDRRKHRWNLSQSNPHFL